MEILTYIINFAIESPQNGLVVLGFFGVFGFFAPELPKGKSKSKGRKGRKAKMPKQNRARTVAKNATVQKPRQWATMPPITPDYIARVERMLRHR